LRASAGRRAEAAAGAGREEGTGIWRRERDSRLRHRRGVFNYLSLLRMSLLRLSFYGGSYIFAISFRTTLIICQNCRRGRADQLASAEGPREMTTPPLPYPFFLLFSLSSSSSAAPPFLGSPHLRAPPLQPSPPLSLLCAAESGDAPVHLVLRRLALPPPVPHFPLHPPPLPCPCCAPPPTESGLTQQRSCTSPPIKGSVAPQGKKKLIATVLNLLCGCDSEYLD